MMYEIENRNTPSAMDMAPGVLFALALIGLLF